MTLHSVPQTSLYGHSGEMELALEALTESTQESHSLQTFGKQSIRQHTDQIKPTKSIITINT